MEHSQNSNNKERVVETPFNWESPHTFFKTSPHYDTEIYSPNTNSQDDEKRESLLVTPSSGHSNNGLPMIELPAAADDIQMEDRIIQSLLQVESMSDKVHRLSLAYPRMNSGRLRQFLNCDLPQNAQFGFYKSYCLADFLRF